MISTYIWKYKKLRKINCLLFSEFWIVCEKAYVTYKLHIYWIVLTIDVDDDDQFKEGDDWEWEKENVPIHQGDDVDASLCTKKDVFMLQEIINLHVVLENFTFLL